VLSTWSNNFWNFQNILNFDITRTPNESQHWLLTFSNLRLRISVFWDVTLRCWFSGTLYFNPFNAKLNPICHLLALLGAHHILHVSRIRVKHNDVLTHQEPLTQWQSIISQKTWILCNTAMRNSKLVNLTFLSDVQKFYWNLYGNSRTKHQLDATCYFIVLLIGLTCFGHYYAHHQELATMMLITRLVVSFCKDGGEIK